MRKPVFWRDCLSAVLIATSVLSVVAVLRWRAPIRHVVSQTATWTAAAPVAATEVPDGFELVWSRPDGAATAPLVVGGVLVTADGDALTGWEVATGRRMWRFAEPAPLCSSAAAWGKVFAVYRGPRGCSRVVSLDAATGRRPAEPGSGLRTGEADPKVQLVTTAAGERSGSKDPNAWWYSHLVFMVGSRRVELWHENLVRSAQYGYVAAPLDSKQRPRPECALRSAVLGEETFAVLERCPGDRALRLSFFKNTPKRDWRPEQTGTTVLPLLGFADDARLLAVRGTRADLYVPASGGNGARVVEVDGRGVVEESYDLRAPATESRTMPWRTSANLITWWTGTGLLGLSPLHLALVFQTPGLAGPATSMAGQLIAPTATGIAVLDPRTGQRVREIQAAGAVPSPDGVRLAVCGSMLLRQQNGRVLVYVPRRPAL